MTQGTDRPETTPTPEPVMCGGCGATSDRERCMGCLHDFGTPESAWVRKIGEAATHG